MSSDLHYKQMPTTYKAIKEQFKTFSFDMPKLLIKCILNENDVSSSTVVSVYLEMLSRFVYIGKDKKYKKPSERIYKKLLFECCVETPSEVKALIKEKYGEVSQAEKIHKALWQIADLVCSMMACLTEQATVFEYAYAINYVIKNSDNLPKPEMNQLFPKNYENYNYWEFESDFPKI